MVKSFFNLKSSLIALSILVVLGVIVWQAVYFQGNPDPTAQNISPGSAIINTAILVFREGLEAILVLSQSLSERNKIHYGNRFPSGLASQS